MSINTRIFRFRRVPESTENGLGRNPKIEIPPAVTMSKINNAGGNLVPFGVPSVIAKSVAGTISFLVLGCFSALGYTTAGTNLLQANGTQSDVQAAINAASDGWTVQIPNGSYTWTSGINISGKGIRLRGQSVGGVTINNNCTSTDLITVSEDTTQSLEISGLRIVALNPGGSQLRHLVVNHTQGGRPVLLHDCYFETNGGTIYRSVDWSTNGGVIWNCQFYSHQQDDSGIAFKNSITTSWSTNPTMGTADSSGTANTYVEDCTFTDVLLQCMDFDDNSRTVVRHCTFSNSGMASHGQDTSPSGARHWEIYDNNFIFTASGGNYPLNINYFFFIRGGTGVIATNTIANIASQTWGDKAEILMTVYNIRRIANAVPCQTRYPAARQMGQGYLNGSIVTDPVYIWGNTGGGNYGSPGLSDYNPDECGNGQTVSNYIKAGRDYITALPSPVTQNTPIHTRCGAVRAVQALLDRRPLLLRKT